MTVYTRTILKIFITQTIKGSTEILAKWYVKLATEHPDRPMGARRNIFMGGQAQKWSPYGEKFPHTEKT